jgi:uncharacterized protein (TIGR03437 family)
MGYNADRQAAAPAYRGNASIAEDPRNRRVNGQGQTRRHVLQVFPMFVPEILGVMRAADGSPVTAVKPLGAGEQVMLLVSNLGPVRGGAMEPGQPFPAGPQYAQVNSPVSVLINGREVEAFNTIGWPGSSDQYRVDFVMPQGVAAGTATIQIQVAFLNGGTASIPVR